MITPSERQWGITYAPYVTCPRCKAGKGNSCTQPNGDTTQTHKQRIALATFHPGHGTTITPKDAAVLLNVHYRTVYEWARDGRLGAFKTELGTWLLDASAVYQQADRKK